MCGTERQRQDAKGAENRQVLTALIVRHSVKFLALPFSFMCYRYVTVTGFVRITSAANWQNAPDR